MMNKKQYKVSICVPVYGVEKYIERCAISLFKQTYDNIEYIFVDDCSVDNSVTILEQTILQFPNRRDSIKIIRHNLNKGLAGARNTAVNESSGDFILWVDSDDSINTSLVEKLIYAQNKNDADIICYNINAQFADHNIVYSNINYKNGYDLAYKMLQGIAPHQLCGHLIRKSLYTDNNIYAVEGINHGEDLHVMPRLAFVANTVGTLHEALYYYDMSSVNSHSNNFTYNSYLQLSRAYDVLDLYFKNWPEFSDLISWKKIAFLADSLLFFSQIDDSSYNEVCKELNSITLKAIFNQRLDRACIILTRSKQITKIISYVLCSIKKIKYKH